MSRVGEREIEIPSGVTVTVADTTVSVKGGGGELSRDLIGGITVIVKDGKVIVARPDDTRQSKSFHGLIRSLIANMVEGVSKGFSKQLEIQGVGFKANMEGQKLVITLGFSSPIEYKIPEGIQVKVDGGTKIDVAGTDKQMVGDVAARIRSFRPAEPYKGKGVLYKGERIRRKVGKTVA